MKYRAWLVAALLLGGQAAGWAQSAAPTLPPAEVAPAPAATDLLQGISLRGFFEGTDFTSALLTVDARRVQVREGEIVARSGFTLKVKAIDAKRQTVTFVDEKGQEAVLGFHVAPPRPTPLPLTPIRKTAGSQEAVTISDFLASDFLAAYKQMEQARSEQYSDGRYVTHFEFLVPGNSKLFFLVNVTTQSKAVPVIVRFRLQFPDDLDPDAGTRRFKPYLRQILADIVRAVDAKLPASGVLAYLEGHAGDKFEELSDAPARKFGDYLCSVATVDRDLDVQISKQKTASPERRRTPRH